jgi:hypothetical protein
MQVMLGYNLVKIGLIIWIGNFGVDIAVYIVWSSRLLLWLHNHRNVGMRKTSLLKLYNMYDPSQLSKARLEILHKSS